MLETLARNRKEILKGNPSKLEYIFADILTSIGVVFIHQYHVDGFDYDFYIPDKNLLIEIDGDYWHGNPTIYTELNNIQKKNKGLDKSLAENYINESVVIYENTINNVTKENWVELNEWLKSTITTNHYSDVDNLFSNNITLLEEKIKSKHSVIESLQQSPKNLVESHELPLNDLVNVANKTISDYLNTLSESDQLKVKNILKETDDKLQLKYEILKENVLEKLTELKVNETDSEIITKIVETTEKIQSENFDKITYLKLRELDKDL
jgi:hypothetical protein